MFAQCPRLPELYRSDSEANLHPVHSRMQKHRGDVAAGDISQIDSTEETSFWPPDMGQEREEKSREEGPG